MGGGGEAPAAGTLGAAQLYCEACGQETLHRIVRLSRGGPRRAVAGLARCRVCRLTHPFVSVPPRRTAIDVVVSSGAESRRERLELPPETMLRLDEPLAGREREGRIRRIDRTDGRAAERARADHVRTLWIAPERPATVRVAVIGGARSTTEQLPVRPGLRLAVGERLRLPDGPVTIAALRARERTWRAEGDGFPVEEVRVVYARRTAIPPAGSRPWSRLRGTPSSRASSRSATSRSRSSPGARRNRAVPRARSAGSGATESSSSFS